MNKWRDYTIKEDWDKLSIEKKLDELKKTNSAMWLLILINFVVLLWR